MVKSYERPSLVGFSGWYFGEWMHVLSTQTIRFQSNLFIVFIAKGCMKRILFWSLLLLIISTFSCRKEDQAPGFDMIYQQEFTIPAGIGVFQVHHFYLKNLATRYEQYLAQHGKTDGDITGVITSQAVLNGIFGDANLNFVDQVSLRVYDEANPSDYIEIAYRQPVPLEQ